MNNYLRPIDDRFQINGVAMPKPHSFKTKIKWNNKSAERDINTGKLLLNPVNRIAETTWTYKLLRDDQYKILRDEVFKDNKNEYTKKFKSIDSNSFVGDTYKYISYETYEQDDFEAPEMTSIQADGHRYYTDITFNFTSIGDIKHS